MKDLCYASVVEDAANCPCQHPAARHSTGSKPLAQLGGMSNA